MSQVWAGRIVGVALAVAVAAAGAPPVGGNAARPHPSLVRDAHAFARAPRPQAAPGPTAGPARRAFASASWWGGTFVTSTGASVSVMVADAYPEGSGMGEAWAELFAGLVHGDELAAMRAYVAPLDWVQAVCGPWALGCYGGGELIVPGTAVDGVSAWEVAAHEYGHHVAASRLNTPWRAIDWGTKRWASHAGICARAAAGTVFPGDDGTRYDLDPGEGFAEAYRVLNERRRGSTAFTWSIVDASFIPNDEALARIEQDVRRPWKAPARRTLSVDLRGKRVVRLPVSTPLDGQVTVDVRLAAGASHDVALLDGTRVVARGRWSGATAQTLTYVVCGSRSLTLRLRRGQGAPRVAVVVAVP